MALVVCLLLYLKNLFLLCLKKKGRGLGCCCFSSLFLFFSFLSSVVSKEVCSVGLKEVYSILLDLKRVVCVGLKEVYSILLDLRRFILLDLKRFILLDLKRFILMYLRMFILLDLKIFILLDLKRLILLDLKRLYQWLDDG